MQFAYRAFAGGRVTRGVVEAPDRSAALGRLRSQGLLVESIRAAPGLRLSLKMELGKPKLSLRQQGVMFGLLALLLEGGVPLLQALQVLAESTREPGRTVLRQMANVVERGNTLSDAMQQHGSLFPKHAVRLIATSELAADLQEGLSLLARQFEAEDQMQRKFRSAMIYPVVVMVMAVGLAAFLSLFIAPNFAGMFRDMGAKLPWQTQLLLAVTGAIANHWAWIAGLFAGGWFLARQASQRIPAFCLWQNRMLLKVPVFGPLFWKREVARYTRTFGSLLKCGVPVLTAAPAVAELVGNAYLAERLREVTGYVTHGASLGQALKRTGFLPPIMAELVVVGEMIGQQDMVMQKIAALTDADVKESLERMTAVLEPLLILFLGAIVLCVVVPVLLPMFDLFTKIK